MTQLEILELALQAVVHKLHHSYFIDKYEKKRYEIKRDKLHQLIKREKNKPPETFDSLRKAGYV